MVSPEGIDPGKAKRKADAVWLILSREPIRDECRELVSHIGIEPVLGPCGPVLE
jgi:hypothetical protein